MPLMASTLSSVMKRITMKDLARQIGVNTSTISRALKNHPDISPEVRERVRQLAEQLNYRPNHMAVYLRQRSSRLIGLVVPQTSAFFFPPLLHGIEQVLHQNGYSLIMMPSNESLEREMHNIQICFDNDVAGLLIAFSRETNDPGHLALLVEAGAPVVMFDNVLEDAPFDSVVLDDFADTVAAVRHLVASGCRHIAGVFGNMNLRITQRRLKGFTSALKQCGLPVNPEHIIFANDTDEAQEGTQMLVKSLVPPDGIFAMTDEVLTGVLPALLDAGKKVPEECALICMSDGFLPHYLRPQVSYLHHNGYEVGRLAAERLCTLIKTAEHLKPKYKGVRSVQPTRLVELATTRPIPKGLTDPRSKINL